MKIYTRTGDQGETGLLGGVRVPKTHIAIAVCGSLDETNSWLGMARSEKLPPKAEELLERIQNELFDLGSRVAACLSESNRPAEFPEQRVQNLERAIDELEHDLQPLEAFILPSGCRAGCDLHMARSVCRRTERDLVRLIELQTQCDLSIELTYLNRLADLLFVLARYVNQAAGQPESKWSASR